MESPYKSTPLLKRPFVALRYACAGLAAAWRHEAAFRLEALAFAVLLPVSFLLGETAVERALLAGSLFLVLIVELGNSALEAGLDRISLEAHPLAGRAKDIGAAAVLVALLNAAAIWGLLLLT